MDLWLVMEGIVSGLRNFFASWLPFSQTWHGLIETLHFQIALKYFFLNFSLVFFALLWGVAVIGGLFRWVAGSAKTNSSEGRIPALVIVFISIAAGFSLMIAELFLLALFQQLDPPSLKILFSITSLFAMGVIYYTRGYLLEGIYWKSTSSYSAPATFFIISLLFIFQYASVFSPSYGDGSSFHIPYADFFLQNRGLAVHEQLIYPYHVFNFNLMYSLGLMLQHDFSYMQSMDALFVTLMMLGIYVFCRESGQRIWIAVFLTFLYSMLFHVIWARRLANVDAAGTWFVFASVFAIWLWQKYRSTPFFVLSACFLGIAVGIKYVLLAFIVPAAICLLYFERSWQKRFVYAGCVFAFGSWWYIRNVLLTGNPVHPFAPGIFGYDLWDEFDMASQLSGSFAAIPKTLAGLFFMPWFACQHEIENSQGAFIIITLLYFSTLYFWLVRDRLNVLLLFSWVYLFSWIASSQDPRHLMPIFPLVFVHFGFVVNRIFNWIADTITHSASLSHRVMIYQSVRGGGFLLLLFFAIVAVGFSLNQTRNEFIHLFYRPAVSDASQETLLRKDPRFDYFYAVNDIFTKEETVFEFAARDGRWFYKPHVVGNQYGPHGYFQVLGLVTDAEGFIAPEKLESLLRIRYDADGFIIPNPGNFPYRDADFGRSFELKFKNEAGSIYRLKRHHNQGNK